MRAVVIGLALLAGVGAATAQPSLRDVPQIDNGLFAVGLAHEIRKNCPAIKGRIFRALGFLKDLEREARDMGFSEDEIRLHLESDVEKKRLRLRAAGYMKDRGYGQDKQGYCALGKFEIAQKSQIGALLRAKR